MPRNAKGKLSLAWHGLQAHRYTVGGSKRPIREMLQVKGLQWQQKILPLLPPCQCVHTTSYLTSKMILTTMQDLAAFKSLQPVQAMPKLQGFLELWAAWHQPCNIHKSEQHKQAPGYTQNQSAGAYEHGNLMHYAHAKFLPTLFTRNWTVPNCLWGQIMQVASL